MYFDSSIFSLLCRSFFGNASLSKKGLDISSLHAQDLSGLFYLCVFSDAGMGPSTGIFDPTQVVSRIVLQNPFFSANRCDDS